LAQQAKRLVIMPVSPSQGNAMNILAAWGKLGQDKRSLLLILPVTEFLGKRFWLMNLGNMHALNAASWLRGILGDLFFVIVLFGMMAHRDLL